SGMLEEAFKKAKRAGLRNAKFMLGDAERLIFPADSFDYIFCASALVLISNMPKALQLWSRFLKPHGGIAFDTPSRPFGISQRVVDIAAAHGVHLAYADVADTPEKCRSLLEKASIKTVHVATELVNSEPMTLSKAIAFWDEHTDHPAWQNLKHASEKTRDVIHTQYIADVTAAAVNGYVPNRVALNFTYGRKPGSAARARS
ncbi:MAG: class I SAM-dependent methyltransferase, partial [Bryobacteraceae bacterium]